MLAGFRSRCTTLWSCAYSSASMICFAIATASSSGSAPACNAIRQRRSFDERQDQPARVFRIHDPVYVSDVGMIERGQNFGFSLEARQSFRIARECCRQNLDRHLAIQFGVFRAIHLAHAAFPSSERTS